MWPFQLHANDSGPEQSVGFGGQWADTSMWRVRGGVPSAWVESGSGSSDAPFASPILGEFHTELKPRATAGRGGLLACVCVCVCVRVRVRVRVCVVRLQPRVGYQIGLSLAVVRAVVAVRSACFRWVCWLGLLVVVRSMRTDCPRLVGVVPLMLDQHRSLDSSWPALRSLWVFCSTCGRVAP